jgi:primosomal protein N' (replication factor Y)
MDTDTTKKKDSYSEILSAFASHQADILVGTQMIVKGHDFPLVTLVGIVAADLSLHVGDFRASERTFQLLCQAAGRAGRDALPGEVVIQTYHPEHYSITTAAEGNYQEFYKQEMLYRSMMQYPPAAHILLVLIISKAEERAEEASIHLGEAIKEMVNEQQLTVQIIGPATASLAKANDYYRRVIYLKHEEYGTLVGIKNYIEGYLNYTKRFSDCSIQFDFDPMSSY